ncbi:MAG: hypothetical protein J6Z74_03815 [Eubacterium sp.]|nr:hypothetical protein [Eubacterium sp.]
MKKLSKTKKIWLIAIISTLILVLFEGVLGVGFGLFSLGSGGEMDAKMTLGGFVHETYYPLTTADDPNGGVSSHIFFNPITFVIMFFVRLFIIIPLVHFFDPSVDYHTDAKSSGRLQGFFKYFVILYMIIGIGQLAILAINSFILKETIDRISQSELRFQDFYLPRRNILIVSIICCVIVVLHHFITDIMILQKKPSYLRFYRLSYILVFICPIIYIFFIIHFKTSYNRVQFFRLQMLIYIIDFILFLINLSYLKDSYEVFEYMNSSTDTGAEDTPAEEA